MSRIHWLGAGLSSGPGIRRLAQADRDMTLWNLTVARAEEVLARLDNHHVEIKKFDKEDLVNNVQAGDVVVSMLPATMHLDIAELCLNKKAHFVSSSYVSPEMQALHEKAKSEGLSFVNETGLDPGLDHLLAYALIEEYKKSESFDKNNQHYFRSYCGGFPKIPNDFKYKFSWSPLGVLRALKSPAKWLAEGKTKTTDAPWNALSNYHAKLPQGEETFQAYPNRDSIPFMAQYGFDDSWNMQEFVRGTLRLNGWSEAWKDIFKEVEGLQGETGEARLKQLSDELWNTQSYDEGEPDRVVLCVELEVRKKGEKVWHHSYALDQAGNETGSAMARLVSLTVSLAVESVLDGKLSAGVSAATHDPELVHEWLDALRELGEKAELLQNSG